MHASSAASLRPAPLSTPLSLHCVCFCSREKPCGKSKNLASPLPPPPTPHSPPKLPVVVLPPRTLGRDRVLFVLAHLFCTGNGRLEHSFLGRRRRWWWWLARSPARDGLDVDGDVRALMAVILAH
uniref:Uncharacterized protein n=2 Tax=Oryza meridionalis TaxID=40149 RepID=A0A0E0DQP9_9ORYZ